MFPNGCQCPPQAAKKSPRGRSCRGGLLWRAPAGELAHDQAEIERENAAQIAFVDICQAPQRGSSQASAVQGVGKTAFDLFTPLPQQVFAALAAHGARCFLQGGAHFRLKVFQSPPRGLPISGHGARSGLMLDGGQFPDIVAPALPGVAAHQPRRLALASMVLLSMPGSRPLSRPQALRALRISRWAAAKTLCGSRWRKTVKLE